MNPNAMGQIEVAFLTLLQLGSSNFFRSSLTSEQPMELESIILSCSDGCPLHPHQLAFESHCKDFIVRETELQWWAGTFLAFPPRLLVNITSLGPASALTPSTFPDSYKYIKSWHSSALYCLLTEHCCSRFKLNRRKILLKTKC